MGAARGSDGRGADRRSRIERMRQEERARERRNRMIAIAASVLVIVGLVVGGWFLFSAGEEAEKVKTAPVAGEKTWSDLSRNHVTKDIAYPVTPPVGGDHDPVWQNCDGDVYTKELRKENAVHSLEHGAVWVTYSNKATADDIEALGDRVSKTPYTLMSPSPGQSAPITLTAWGRQLDVQNASDPRVPEFLEKYVQGPQTPEPGAVCTGGKSD
ncbi:DUF3105 domain-containing protein [Streptomyces sp. P9(2023)]|uniref:DUF3105 domain-containing protein n=1 Tax=Streptomyces sp. P9(2023) TaxID=3064394 RepID=UPI0028F42DB9|nr:DUF3105 domain-containing protein [Streptomyces sp. P9(2023)]MDT9693001.1 DUF3105 domain-containing protein [Streptomyces sp. P9(2023)]